MTAQRGEMRRYAGKTLEERDEERRARLLEAGLEVFGTVGYGASAIEVICSTARVATRDFYSLFGSKEQLLRAVDDQIVAEATARIKAEVKGTLIGVEEMIRAGLHTYAQFFAADRRRARVHFFEALTIAGDGDEQQRDIGNQLLSSFRAQAQSLMDRGLIPARDLSITSGALAGATRYAMSDWAANPAAHSIDEIIDELVRLYVAALG